MPMHTDREFEQELIHLREKLLLMGAKVEAMIHSAVGAFDGNDVDLARRTIDADHDVNRIEIEIDGCCLEIMARRQPMASDLRFIATTLKFVTDLERMGDLAVNISERVIESSIDPPKRSWPEIQTMAGVVQGMVRDALDAFMARDNAKARWVIERDRGVDSMYVQLFHGILLSMMEDRNAVQRGICVQSIAKYLERIGDHATNLAEMVVFLTEGTDIRHNTSLHQGGD